MHTTYELNYCPPREYACISDNTSIKRYSRSVPIVICFNIDRISHSLHYRCTEPCNNFRQDGVRHLVVRRGVAWYPILGKKKQRVGSAGIPRCMGRPTHRVSRAIVYCSMAP